jgi:hypothetical protein
MIKAATDKRHPLVTSVKRTSQLNLPAVGEPVGVASSCCHGGFSSSLEVVSQERFQQQLEGMSSSVDADRRSKLEQQTQSLSQRSMRCSRGKRNMPIVVCLRESIRTHGGRRSSKLSAGSDRRTLSESSASVADVSVQTLISMSEELPSSAPPTDDKRAKNFNAFLSAIEKVHSKGHKLVQPARNVEHSIDRKKVNMTHSSATGLAVLNNEDPSAGSVDMLRPLELAHCKNIDLIHNDLKGPVRPLSDSMISDDHSELTEPESSCGRSSSSESDSEPNEELSGDSQDVAPHQCPKCLAAYYAYTHYYALGSKYFKIEVVDDDGNYVNDSSDGVYVETETQHHSWRPFNDHRHIDVVSLDLTGSDVTFTVEQLAVNSSSSSGDCSSSRSPSSPEFSHNFYCTMFGFMPCVPGYCFVPAYYFTFPMWSVSKSSASCLSNTDKSSVNARSASSQLVEPLCSCEFTTLLSHCFVKFISAVE